MALLSTGIQGLDAQFGGGFPSGSTILVVSDASNAPFVMDSQFAAGGLNAGQTVYFYSLERPKEEVVEEVKSFLTTEVIAKLVYFDAFSVRLKGLNAAQMKKLGINNHAVDVTQDVVPRMLQESGDTPFRIIIESLTEAINSYGTEAVMKMVETVTGITRRMNAVTLMSIEKGVADAKFEARLRHLVDGLIEFGVDRQGFGLYLEDAGDYGRDEASPVQGDGEGVVA